MPKVHLVLNEQSYIASQLYIQGSFDAAKATRAVSADKLKVAEGTRFYQLLAPYFSQVSSLCINGPYCTCQP